MDVRCLITSIENKNIVPNYWCIQKIKLSLLICNIFYFSFGFIIFLFGIYDPNANYLRQDIRGFHLIWSGICICLIASFALFAVFKENANLLLSYAGLMLTILSLNAITFFFYLNFMFLNFHVASWFISNMFHLLLMIAAIMLANEIKFKNDYQEGRIQSSV